ncbi:zinc finger BED domain-containing protein RICESLEEPER 1-like [Carya illinoinensis]|uniref:zinc finger BED domain-containing protein RICESLEEPER 1-like n=1 Tax=Carya illinoinensis TaxID=32201 RepID=UPI001C71A9FB|nr:zinc finger BED domain-containing protein RICESLEEPER 1-like [Carya illinoinensis]
MEYLYEAYVEFGGGCVIGANKTQSGEASASMGSSSIVTDYDPLDFLREFHKEHTASLMDSKSELERYLLENIEIPTGSFDILIWWKVNSTKYPVLALMARDILAIPITTVASESAFSTGGRVLDPFRSSLAPKTVEALVCSQNWLKSTPICLSQNYSEVIDDAESYKLDSELANSMASILREDD